MMRGKFSLLVDDDEVAVYDIQNLTAIRSSCKSANWRINEHYNEYVKDIRFLLIPAHLTSRYEKYFAYFPSHEFLDYHNKPMSLESLFKRFPSFQKYLDITGYEYQYDDTITESDDDLLEHLLIQIKSIGIDYVLEKYETMPQDFINVVIDGLSPEPDSIRVLASEYSAKMLKPLKLNHLPYLVSINESLNGVNDKKLQRHLYNVAKVFKDANGRWRVMRQAYND